MPDEHPDVWDALEFGAPCPVESAYIAAWKKNDIAPGRFWKPEEREMLDELIFADVLRNRAMMALQIATDGDIVRGQMIGRGELDGPESFRRVAYYANRHWRHILQIHYKLMPMYRGMMAIARYQRELVESYNKITKRREESSA